MNKIRVLPESEKHLHSSVRIIVPIRNQLFGANVIYNRGRLQQSYIQVSFVM